MVNKRNNTKKRKTNPLARNTISRAPRMKLAFDGQHLRGITYLPSMVTAANFAKATHAIACMNNGAAVGGNLAAMMNFYKEYKYISVVFEWIPAVAPGVADGGSEITISTTWNPEQIVTYAAALPPAAVGFQRSERNVRSFNAWERFTYSVPLHYRRKQFDVDVNPIGYLTDENLVDRSIQGAVVVVAQSLSAIAQLGKFRVHWEVRLEGVGTIPT